MAEAIGAIVTCFTVTQSDFPGLGDLLDFVFTDEDGESFRLMSSGRVQLDEDGESFMMSSGRYKTLWPFM